MLWQWARGVVRRYYPLLMGGSIFAVAIGLFPTLSPILGSNFPFGGSTPPSAVAAPPGNSLKPASSGSTSLASGPLYTGSTSSGLSGVASMSGSTFQGSGIVPSQGSSSFPLFPSGSGSNGFSGQPPGGSGSGSSGSCPIPFSGGIPSLSALPVPIPIPGVSSLPSLPALPLSQGGNPITPLLQSACSQLAGSIPSGLLSSLPSAGSLPGGAAALLSLPGYVESLPYILSALPSQLEKGDLPGAISSLLPTTSLLSSLPGAQSLPLGSLPGLSPPSFVGFEHYTNSSRSGNIYMVGMPVGERIPTWFESEFNALDRVGVDPAIILIPPMGINYTVAQVAKWVSTAVADFPAARLWEVATSLPRGNGAPIMVSLNAIAQVLHDLQSTTGIRLIGLWWAGDVMPSQESHILSFLRSSAIADGYGNLLREVHVMSVTASNQSSQSMYQDLVAPIASSVPGGIALLYTPWPAGNPGDRGTAANVFRGVMASPLRVYIPS